MALRHLISIETLTMDEWNDLYRLARDIMERPGDYSDACRGKVMATLFFEPSTRTNFSFQAAMMRLGGSVFGFSNPSATSASKGETLMDTIRMCSGYSDLIVVRSPYEGSALAASMYSEVPVINAGDGAHMHPTQTLADLTTITSLRGSVDGLQVGICGDLKNGRTVHSLILGLSKFKNITYYLISPRELALPNYMLTFLKQSGQKFIEITNLESALPQLDVLYMTRIQRERFEDPAEYERNKGIYVLTAQKMELAKKDMLVMHPLPRVDEIATDVDADPRAAYFRQARYGMFVRMALIMTLSALPREPENPPRVKEKGLCRNPKCITRFEPELPALFRGEGEERRCSYCDAEIS